MLLVFPWALADALDSAGRQSLVVSGTNLELPRTQVMPRRTSGLAGAGLAAARTVKEGSTCSWPVGADEA